ncbi:MAG: hypothetical protein KAH67_01055 [Flavobacteriaceae bacterium]|nr:hypothetical protein [Flavobacteriaceae bacterium]
MLKYSINIIIFLFSISLFSQTKLKDHSTYKDRYGLRVGIDIFQPIYSLFDEDKNGLEIVADYRVSKRFFIATEFGYSEATTQEDFYNFYTNGQFIKVGADFNAYKNWIGMENVIVVGLRYGFSTFDQTVNEYAINADPFLPPQTISTPTTYDGLNAQWIELVLGIKVEVIHNIFLGFSFRGNQMISSKDPDNFKNLYVPGFNRVYLNDNGFSFNYTISYLIPLYRK